MTKRGDEIARPPPWTVRAADRRAGIGWDELLRQVPEAADRAGVSITGDPRRTDSRQHRLKGSLRVVTVGDRCMEQWQFEVTAGGRIWYGSLRPVCAHGRLGSPRVRVPFGHDWASCLESPRQFGDCPSHGAVVLRDRYGERRAFSMWVRTLVAAWRRSGLVDQTAGSMTPRKISRKAKPVRHSPIRT